MADATLTEFAGDTFERTITVTDASGNPIDITGWTFVLTVKEQKDDSDANAILKETVTSHTAPLSGTTTLSVPPSETDDLLGDYWYDIKYEDDTGYIETVLNGVFRVEDSITDTV